jgi:hypothetical protein
MVNKTRKQIIVVVFFMVLGAVPSWARDITFCGELIPVDNNFVAQKLMNVIRRQIPAVNLPQLRRKAALNFPMVEYYLKAANMPADLKYIPIVESGFTNATSKVGAQGYWQFMEATARARGLVVNDRIDERNNPLKSTIAAIQELASLYKQIQRDYKVSSWVLTAAAYNYGIGNMYKKMRTQGKNYFSMDLNPETAVYVYKIIAVKELFEYPEIYMKNFQYNIFNAATKKIKGAEKEDGDDDEMFKAVTVNIQKDDGTHLDNYALGKVPPPTKADLQQLEKEKLKQARLVVAKIKGEYRKFNDGDSVYIELQENLETSNQFKRTGTVIKGRGWIIDKRVFIDLGFGGTEVILYDLNSQQGVALTALRNNEQLLLRVEQ